MPSIIGHSLTGTAAAYICKERFPEIKFKKFLFLSVLAANLPDVDIL